MFPQISTRKAEGEIWIAELPLPNTVEAILLVKFEFNSIIKLLLFGFEKVALTTGKVPPTDWPKT